MDDFTLFFEQMPRSKVKSTYYIRENIALDCCNRKGHNAFTSLHCSANRIENAYGSTCISLCNNIEMSSDQAHYFRKWQSLLPQTFLIVMTFYKSKLRWSSVRVIY
jgi:hypothetical protein